MAETVTLEEVWRLFKASDEKFDRLVELGDRRHAETEAAMARSRAETEAIMARSRTETEAAMRELTRKMDRLSDRIGEFAEGMVIPAVRRLFAERGIEVHRIARHVEGAHDGRTTEFDIVLANARHIVAIEVKSRLKVPDVVNHVRRMKNFKDYFPEYRDRVVLGAVAGMVVDDEAGRFAYRQGLFVLAQSGETVIILNNRTFRPKAW